MKPLQAVRTIIYIFLVFLATGCSTFSFDNLLTTYEQSESGNISEIDLSYNYTVMGVPARGIKSVIESIYTQESTGKVFYFVSFPSVAVIVTDPEAGSYRYANFKTRSLDTLFGYTSINDEDAARQTSVRYRVRPSVSFYESDYDPQIVVFTVDNHYFVTKDGGVTWKRGAIPWNIENNPIINVIFRENGSVVAATANRLFRSDSGLNRWEEIFFNGNILSCLTNRYINLAEDQSNGRLYLTLKGAQDNDSNLSRLTFNRFYSETNLPVNQFHGVYMSDNDGITWSKVIDIPLIPHFFEDKTVWVGIYPMDLYVYPFSNEFRSNPFYTSGVLSERTVRYAEYEQYLKSLTPENYRYFSTIHNRYCVYNEDFTSYTIEAESDYGRTVAVDNTIKGLVYIKTVDINIDYSVSDNFCYEYNAIRMFDRWTGGFTNGAVNIKENNGMFVRYAPTQRFIDQFNTTVFNNQKRLNSIHPFLKRSVYESFFQPHEDSTNGETFVLQYSINGVDWQDLYTSDYIKRTIDPIGQKRSALYWYREVDTKKNFRLSVSFGFDNLNSLIVYPEDIIIFQNKLLFIVNYYSLTNSYKDAYWTRLPSMGENR